jgi:hypothetical protein
VGRIFLTLVAAVTPVSAGEIDFATPACEVFENKRLDHGVRIGLFTGPAPERGLPR